jgi:hypothetical protein
MGTGIDHISKMEYWRIMADPPGSAQTNMELSFSFPQSGRVTDPAFLDVAGFSGSQWSDRGHTAVTGSVSYGSVVSGRINDFTGEAFTLASTADLENPLPLRIIQFEGKEKNGYAVFNWTVGTPAEADHFELLEADDTGFHVIGRIPANSGQIRYSWQDNKPMQPGLQYYKMNVVDRQGMVYPGTTVSIKREENNGLLLAWIPAFLFGGNQIQIRAPAATVLEYRIISVSGQLLMQGKRLIPEGESGIFVPDLAKGSYFFCGLDSGKKAHVLRFAKN